VREGLTRIIVDWIGTRMMDVSRHKSVDTLRRVTFAMLSCSRNMPALVCFERSHLLPSKRCMLADEVPVRQIGELEPAVVVASAMIAVRRLDQPHAKGKHGFETCGPIAKMTSGLSTPGMTKCGHPDHSRLSVI